MCSIVRVAALLILLLSAACAPGRTEPTAPGSSQAPSEAPRAERTMVMAMRVEPATIAARPLGSPGAGVKASARLFNASLDLIDDRNLPRPYLAEALPQLNTDSWRVFLDGRMETSYRLKPNLTWHDGVPLSAADFVLSWRVYSTPELGAAAAPPFSLMEEVVATDDRTLVIRWRRAYPYAAVLQATGTLTHFPAIPRHVMGAPYEAAEWEAFAAQPYWTREYIGLGPYRLERWEPGASIEGVAFPGHVGGRPKIERIRLIFTPDSNTALANMLSGNIHVAVDNGLAFQQAITAKREWAPYNGGNVLYTTDLYRATYVQFRPEMLSPRALGDVRVRRALAHALDKQTLNDTLYEGDGIMTETILPPGVDYHPVIDRAISKYPYDLRRSEQLMSEAGFTKGSDGVYASPTEGRLAFELKVNASPLYENERSIMASVWRQAGFDVQEAVLPAAQAQDGQARASFPGLYSFSTGLGESALPNFTTALTPRPDNRWFGNNRGAWANADYDRLSDTFNSTLDRDQRIQQMAQMTRILSEELPTISLYYDLGIVAHLAAVRGPVPVGPDTSGLVAWNVVDWEMN